MSNDLSSPVDDRTGHPVAGGLHARLRRAKGSYTTRSVPMHDAVSLAPDAVPAAGDVVLATVTALGQHARLESPTGRRQVLVVGDEVVVAYGARYAPDQFEAVVPPDLGPCQLVAAGGLAGRVDAAHASMRPATSIAPVGVLTDAAGERLRLTPSAHLGGTAGETGPRGGAPMVTVVVVGSSMNSGKTTSAAHLVQGLSRAGVRVGAAKVTGTGAGGDRWFLLDSGAEPVLDFTDAGLPSTYLVPHEELVDTFHRLHGALRRSGCEVAVLEIADGVFQQETARLLEDPRVTGVVDGLLFATVDALSAVAGLGWLRERGLSPLAVTGVVSASPLASREARLATGAEVWEAAHLAHPGLALALWQSLRDGLVLPAHPDAWQAAARERVALTAAG